MTVRLSSLQGSGPARGAAPARLPERVPGARWRLARRAQHGALAAGLGCSARYYRGRLKSERFSIVSSDCWGAAVYQHLRVRYQTPFVGLFLPAPCFLELLSDVRGYLGSPLEFAEESRYAELESERRRGRAYPVGLLGGRVEVHLAHYATWAEAREKWQRRCDRVDYDNLFVKLSADKDLCTPEHVRRFDAMPYANKVCLTARSYPDVRSAIRIPGYVRDGATMYRLSLPHVNVVRWLNGGRARRRQAG
jgi:uncharacterized protein (DUF1919 family)